jgi:hypothetical protein
MVVVVVVVLVVVLVVVGASLYPPSCVPEVRVGRMSSGGAREGLIGKGRQTVARR